jgi:hypothetical protein
MNAELNSSRRILLGATLLTVLWLPTVAADTQSFDLAHAKGLEQFAGSAAARELLARNGFVV